MTTSTPSTQTPATPASASPSDGREAQRRSNVRLGWTLASIALMFALGFVAKAMWLGH